MTIGQTIQEPSISMQDDNGQMTDKTIDESSNHNKNSKKTTLDNNHINKTSSNSNVFSRLMHSEPHVQIKKNYIPTNNGCCFTIKFFSILSVLLLPPPSSLL
jgi:hypothetical protein